jgi:hypothetical protein
MRKLKIGLLAGATVAALSQSVNAAIVYQQNFSVNSGAGMTALSAVNWNAYYGSATQVATPATAGSSGNPANAMISGGPSGPTTNADVNATQVAGVTSGDSYGFVPLLSYNGSNQIVCCTNEYTIDPAVNTPTAFSWDAASGYSGDLQRLIVQINGQWYASTSPISPPPGVIAGTSFQNGSGTFSTPFSNAASSWDLLNFTPGSDLRLGSQLTGPLPAGDITGFGIYAQIADSAGVSNERTFIDSFEVNASSEVPEPATGTIFIVTVLGTLMRRKKALA